MLITTLAFKAPSTPNAQFEDFLDNSEDQISDQSKKMSDSNTSPDKENLKRTKFNFKPLTWTPSDEQKLIQLHKKCGNRWTLLSRNFPGSSQNFIKNYFYSRLRKSIRKLNKSITTQFGKRYTKFNLNIIFKLSNISEGKVMGKCNVETQITTFYKDFIYQLIQFSENQTEKNSQDRDQLMEQVQTYALSLIALENLFRIISGERVYKGKKKNIAYLKRFHFKLDCRAQRTLVISKQNCYISNQPFEADAQLQKSSESLSGCSIEDESGGSQFFIKRLASEQNKTQKSDQKMNLLMESCQNDYVNDYVSSKGMSPLESSPSQYSLLDSEMREFQMPILWEKDFYCQTLLDQFSGTQFNFQIIE